MKLIYCMRRIVFTNIIRLRVKECGSDLHVNHWCSIPRHAVLGNNVNFNGMKIRGAVIQAGSVVVNDIPPLAVAGGAPARVFKMRDADHYYKLKEKGSFG